MENFSKMLSKVRNHVKGYAPEVESELRQNKYLCGEAEGRMYMAIQHKVACLLNRGSLVFKLDVPFEEQVLHDATPTKRPEGQAYYGVPVALCIQDDGPFKRGQWYRLANKDRRRELLDLFKSGSRVVDFPIENDDWRIMTEVKKNNMRVDLLAKADAYAKELLVPLNETQV